MSETPRLDAIAEKGNRGHRRVENNWITCKDGTKLSVIAGGGTYSVPRPLFCTCDFEGVGATTFGLPGLTGEVDHDYPGPYTSVEVMLDEDVDVTTMTVGEVRAYIAQHGGEADV